MLISLLLVLLFLILLKYTMVMHGFSPFVWCKKMFRQQRQLSASQSVRHIQLQQMTTKFGHFFSLSSQNGGTEFITSDPALVKEVFATKFSHFSARKGFASTTGHVFIASGDHWKRLRKRVSIFSTTNINSFDPLLNASLDSMLRSMATNEGKVFDFHKTSLHLIAAILARITFFTVSPHRSLDEFCEAYTAFAEQLLVLKESARKTRALPQAKCGGGGAGEGGQQEDNGYHQQDEEEAIDIKFDMFTALYKHILEMEKQNHAEEDGRDGGDDQHEQEDANNAANHFACSLGKLFLKNAMKSVGIDTIGHCLAIVVHFMAQNASVQHRLRHELLQMGIGIKESLLADAIIKETLRLCPIVAFASSRCCTSSVVGLGSNSSVTFGAGDSVEVDVFTMGRRRAVWGEDADQFRPNRWLSGGALPAEWRSHWLPFGRGPRACVGFPLAVHVLKMAMAELFCRFHIVSAAGGTEENDIIHLVGSDVLWPDKVLIKAEPVGAVAVVDNDDEKNPTETTTDESGSSPLKPVIHFID